MFLNNPVKIILFQAGRSHCSRTLWLRRLAYTTLLSCIEPRVTSPATKGPAPREVNRDESLCNETRLLVLITGKISFYKCKFKMSSFCVQSELNNTFRSFSSNVDCNNLVSIRA